MRVCNILLGAALLLCIRQMGAHAQTQDEQETVRRLSEAGQTALASGHFSVAEQDFLELRKIEPGVAEIDATLAAIYYQEKAFTQVISAIRRAQKIKPGLTGLDALLSMALAETGNYKDALPGLRTCFAASAKATVRRMCGLQLMRSQGALHMDIEAVQTALELNQIYPDDPEILYNTAKVSGSYAYLTMSRLAARAPGSVWRHLAAAEAYESQGAADQAMGEYEAVLAIQPTRINVHYRMGRTLLAQSHLTGDRGLAERARSEFAAELGVNAEHANAAYELAELDRQAGLLDRAAAYFKQALQQHPEFTQAESGLAAVYVAQHKPREALAPLKAALAIDDGDEVCWYRLAQVERMLGDTKEQQNALAHFQQLHALAATRDASAVPLAMDEVTRQQVAAEEAK